MNDDTCQVDGCDKPIKRKRTGYCYGHYMKNWRYGTPTPEHQRPTHTSTYGKRASVIDLTGQRFGTLVIVEKQAGRWLCQCDCGRQRRASTGELNREGDANTCGDRRTHRRRDDIGYSGAHERVRSDRGPITDQACVGCGSPAQHWSYNHSDLNERLGTSGYSTELVPYSPDPSHYSPRCVPCHKRFDLEHLRTAS